MELMLSGLNSIDKYLRKERKIMLKDKIFTF